MVFNGKGLMASSIDIAMVTGKKLKDYPAQI
jgi:hypothetical protein